MHAPCVIHHAAQVSKHRHTDATSIMPCPVMRAVHAAVLRPDGRHGAWEVPCGHEGAM